MSAAVKKSTRAKRAASAKPAAPAATPRRGRPPANLADRRAAIVGAARAVFGRHGLEAASMRLIAREAGVAAPTLYLYFKGARNYTAQRFRLAHRTQVAAGGRRRRRHAARAGPCCRQRVFQVLLPESGRRRPWSYLNRGLGPRGLNPDLDARLNRELLDALLPLTSALQAHQGRQRARRQYAAFSLASSAMGIAIFHHTRRDKSLHVDATAAFGQLLRLDIPSVRQVGQVDKAGIGLRI